MYISASNSTPQKSVLMGVALTGGWIESSHIDNAINLLGGIPNFVQFYRAFPKDADLYNRPFTYTSVEAIAGYGAIPVFTWEPFYFPDGSTQTHISLEEIKSGKYDAYMKEHADGFKYCKNITPFKIVCRLMHEHNLAGTYWWAENDVANIDADTPGRYIEMYNYIIDFMKNEGVDNVMWAWCPNNDNFISGGSQSWNTITNSWPGIKNVDIVGLDGYSGPTYGATRSIQQICEFTNSEANNQKAIEEIKAQTNKENPNKTVPFWIFETNWKDTSSPPSASDKRDWWLDGIDYCRQNGVDAVCQFYVVSKDQLITTDYYTDKRATPVDNSQLVDLYPEYVYST